MPIVVPVGWAAVGAASMLGLLGLRLLGCVLDLRMLGLVLGLRLLSLLLSRLLLSGLELGGVLSRLLLTPISTCLACHPNASVGAPALGRGRSGLRQRAPGG